MRGTRRKGHLFSDGPSARVSVRVNVKIHKRMKQQCAGKNYSMSQFMEHVLLEYFDWIDAKELTSE